MFHPGHPNRGMGGQPKKQATYRKNAALDMVFARWGLFNIYRGALAKTAALALTERS